MLDFRYQTFLTLYKILSYTKTAQILNMTQPAVTQHIQHLEGVYGCKLFEKSKNKITPTKQGSVLFKYVQRINADAEQIKKAIAEIDANRVIHFGATLTIGEYLMPAIIEKLIVQGTQVNMLVENTESLLKRLDNGEIMFAITEGFFDKAAYAYQLLKKEQFVAVCTKTAKLCTSRLEKLFSERLILREKGSGTRDVLEKALGEKSFSVNNFEDVLEIGSMTAIKKLVEAGCGISFMYKCAVDENLQKIKIPDFEIQREFNFVYNKNTALEHNVQSDICEIINLAKSIYG